MVVVNEPIEVVALFKKQSITPLIFLWRNRKIKVSQVNLVHTSKEGSRLFYHFSVSSGSSFYKLNLEISELRWILEQVEEIN